MMMITINFVSRNHAESLPVVAPAPAHIIIGTRLAKGARGATAPGRARFLVLLFYRNFPSCPCHLHARYNDENIIRPNEIEK